MHVTNVTAWDTLHGSAHKEAVVEVEETVAVTGMAVLAVEERNASSVTNLDTLRASAKRIKIFAIVATVWGTLQKTVNRLVNTISCSQFFLDTSGVHCWNWKNCEQV